MNIRTIAATALLAAVAGHLAGGVVTSTVTASPIAQVTSPRLATMAPCKYEDGSGSTLPCYWDATTRGNGVGVSFWLDKHGRQHNVKAGH